MVGLTSRRRIGGGHTTQPLRSPREQRVPTSCPTCGHHELRVLRGCRATVCQCPRCSAIFSLGDLASRVDDDAFERLAEAVGGHLADRV